MISISKLVLGMLFDFNLLQNEPEVLFNWKMKSGSCVVASKRIRLVRANLASYISDESDGDFAEHVERDCNLNASWCHDESWCHDDDYCNRCSA